MPPDHQENPLDRALELFDELDFAALREHLRGEEVPPIDTYLPIHPNRFDVNGVNGLVLTEIEDTLAQHPLVVLLGTTKVGKTSVANRWIADSPARCLLRLKFAKEPDEIELALAPHRDDKDGFCLDEVTCPSQLEAARTLAHECGKKVVISLCTAVYSDIRQEVDALGVPIIKVGLPSDDEIRSFVANVLQLPSDHHFVEFITIISENSVCAAANMVDFLVRHFADPSMRLLTSRAFIFRLLYNSDFIAVINHWDHQRQHTDPDLQHLIPDLRIIQELPC